MEDSILKSTKKILGLAADYTPFDLDVITHINAAFSTLYQLGVGPTTGFAIEDDTAVWDDFIVGDISIVSACKTYVYLRTRLLFDPPTTSFTLSSMKEQLQEYEFRISVLREDAHWIDPSPSEEVIVDYGF
jgi:hypothetical protein